MTTTDRMHTRYQTIWPHLDEKGRRLWAASEAKAIGRGGIKVVHEVTGMSRSVISEGIRELTGERLLPEGRIRRAGAGRKLLKTIDKTLFEDLKTLVEGTTRGDPESPLYGRPKVSVRLPHIFVPWATTLAMSRSESFSLGKATVCKETERPWKEAFIPTATHSSILLRSE